MLGFGETAGCCEWGWRLIDAITTNPRNAESRKTSPEPTIAKTAHGFGPRLAGPGLNLTTQPAGSRGQRNSDRAPDAAKRTYVS